MWLVQNRTNQTLSLSVANARTMAMLPSPDTWVCIGPSVKWNTGLSWTEWNSTRCLIMLHPPLITGTSPPSVPARPHRNTPEHTLHACNTNLGTNLFWFATGITIVHSFGAFVACPHGFGWSVYCLALCKFRKHDVPVVSLLNCSPGKPEVWRPQEGPPLLGSHTHTHQRKEEISFPQVSARRKRITVSRVAYRSFGVTKQRLVLPVLLQLAHLRSVQ